MSRTLTVPLSVSGTAQAEDYTLSTSVTFVSGQTTASVTLDAIDDPDFEVDETVIVAIGSSLPPETLVGTPNSVTLTISRSDADTTVRMVTLDQEAIEGNSVTLEFSRSGGDLSRILSIPLSVSGAVQSSGLRTSTQCGICSEYFHS